MVSPLKTWHYQEPKGLWPAVGGLALLTHVGVLGLSLPYVLEMMRPSGQSTAAIIPIELIEVDPIVSPTEPATDATARPDKTTNAATDPTTSPAARPPRVLAAEPVAAEPVASGPSNSTLTSPANPTPVAQPRPQTQVPQTQVPQTQTPQTQTPETEDTTQNNEAPAEPNSPKAPNAESPEASNEGSSNTEADDEASNSSSSETTAEETPLEPTTLPSEGPTLPSPEEVVTESDREQVAYLSLVSHSHIPNSDLLTDLADTPATPIYEAMNGIALRPESAGCEKVDFARSQVTYRVEISPQGRLRSAVPWTGSIEPYNMSEEEIAISCLIVSAEFQFNPALKDGEPVANSNLLLTIDIIESGLN